MTPLSVKKISFNFNCKTLFIKTSVLCSTTFIAIATKHSKVHLFVIDLNFKGNN